MRRCDAEKHEALVQAVARGEPFDLARLTAGYAPSTRSVFVFEKNPAFLARVAEIRTRADAQTASDIPAIIERLLAVARDGEKLSSAAAIDAIRQCLLAAAALKLRLMNGPLNGEGESESSLAEWLAAYGPKS